MIIVKQPDFGTTSIEHHRTQGRLNSRVPIAFEWTEDGKQFRTQGYTLDVSPRGCLALVALRFAVGQHLRLTNLANQNSCEVLLVWSRNEGGNRWAVGIELREPVPDFWGLDL